MYRAAALRIKSYKHRFSANPISLAKTRAPRVHTRDTNSPGDMSSIAAATVQLHAILRISTEIEPKIVGSDCQFKRIPKRRTYVHLLLAGAPADDLVRIRSAATEM